MLADGAAIVVACVSKFAAGRSMEVDTAATLLLEVCAMGETNGLGIISGFFLAISGRTKVSLYKETNTELGKMVFSLLIRLEN